MVPPSRASSTSLPFCQLAKASVRGALELFPSSFIFWKIGDSLRRSRIQTETPSRSTETRNGIRQPHAAKSASPVAVRVNRITSSDRNRPSVAVVWMKDV